MKQEDVKQRCNEKMKHDDIPDRVSIGRWLCAMVRQDNAPVKYNEKKKGEDETQWKYNTKMCTPEQDER